MRATIPSLPLIFRNIILVFSELQLVGYTIWQNVQIFGKDIFINSVYTSFSISDMLNRTLTFSS